MDRYECVRCEHRWIPRSDTPPQRCPGCGHREWKDVKAEKEVENQA